MDAGGKLTCVRVTPPPPPPPPEFHAQFSIVEQKKKITYIVYLIQNRALSPSDNHTVHGDTFTAFLVNGDIHFSSILQLS